MRGFTISFKVFGDALISPTFKRLYSSDGNLIYAATWLWWGILFAPTYAIKLTNEQPEVWP